MADYGTFQHGAVKYPLPTSTGNTALRDADPPVFFMLEYFASILSTYMGARFLAEAAACGAPITVTVAAKVPYPPERYGLEEQLKFPLLCVYRKTGRYNYRTMVREHDTGTFGVAYLLPTLTAGQAEVLEPFLRSAKEILNYMTDQGWDPSYTPTGGAIGDQPWSAKYAGVESIGIDTWSVGAYPGLGTLAFPALILEGTLKERSELPDATFAGRSKLDGIDGHVDSTDAQQSTVPDLVQFATHAAPTLASLTAATGPIAGGTAVTLTGTGFRAGATVTFGNLAAAAIVINSATSITCTTPAHEPGAVDVVVTNTDGGAATLAASFTFT